MKRAIPLSFLLFANVILLAYLVVPHHHHEKTGACFADFLCKDGNEKHHHEPTNKHEKNSFPEQCCFDVYVLTGNNTKPACRFHKKCDCGHHLPYATILTTLYTCDFVDDTVIYFRQNPFVPLFYSEFISQSIGLRAPPVC